MICYRYQDNRAYGLFYNFGPDNLGILETNPRGVPTTLVSRGFSAVSPNGKARNASQMVNRISSNDDIEAAIHADAWNEVTIIAQGHRIQHFINGTKVAELVDEQEQARRLSGRFRLGIWANQNLPIIAEFKDIRVKDLR